ncbi:MAG: hypothetical protein PVI56_07610 [Gammaproteobacteria bacterium]
MSSRHNGGTEYPREKAIMQSLSHLGEYPVLEFRRYTLVPDACHRFTRYFESFFPEAFEQLGSMVLGSFHEREDPQRFTWLRGFHDMNSRAIINAAFYYGPLWKEHRDRMNSLMQDSDDVMLLRPLHADDNVMLLPAVDPVDEAGTARGVLVARIFSVTPGRVEAFAAWAEGKFASYRAAGIRQAGLLATLEEANNFPQLPVRVDGPFVVWLGVARDNQAADLALLSLAEEDRTFLVDSDFLRAPPETVVMDPTPRSRLRWLPDWEQVK